MSNGSLLSAYTTLQVGGAAARIVTITDTAQLLEVLSGAAAEAAAPLILGSGSNVLVPDAGYPGTVIVMANKGISYTPLSDDAVLVSVAAGELLDDVVAETVERSLWGLENLSAIPGTVGATPIQNVGAYGVEVSDLIVSVTAMHRTSKEERVFTNHECQFAYRTSFFKTSAGREWVITQVDFKLYKQPQPRLSYGTLNTLVTMLDLTPAHVRAEVISIRAEKFPNWHEVGTAGSFFKNPVITGEHYNKLLKTYPELPGFTTADGVKVPLGYVLDKICGLRGHQEGKVRLYEKQALVLVASGGATATEIKEFAARVAAEVKAKTDIAIEPEVTFV